ncbi:MAG: type IV secretory system conjugative DNA transfer family protein [Henriciella sp.]|nr:type IV secretory system conjugative DNA transfer family protein [Henriciella sp.]
MWNNNLPEKSIKFEKAALEALFPYIPGYKFKPRKPSQNPLDAISFATMNKRKRRRVANLVSDGVWKGMKDWLRSTDERGDTSKSVFEKYEETLWLFEQVRPYLDEEESQTQKGNINRANEVYEELINYHLKKACQELEAADTARREQGLFRERAALARQQAYKGPPILALEFPLDWKRVWDERRIMGLGSAKRYAPHMIAPYSGLKDGLDAPLIGMWPDRFRKLDPTLVVDRSERHLTSVMITGGGKSACHIIPTLLTYKGSLVVMDTKGDLYRATADQLRSKDKKVLRLNLFEENSPDKFNPFDFIGGPLSKGFQKRIRLFVSNLIDQKQASGDSAYWLQQADQAIRAITEYLLAQAPEGEPKNIEAMLKMAKHPRGIKRTAEALKQFADSESYPLEWSEGLIRTSEDWDKQAPITESEIKTVLDPWDEVVQGNSLTSTFHPSDLVEHADHGEQFVLFIDMPSGLGKTYEAVIRTVLVCIIDGIKEERSKGEKRGLPVLFLLDEFLNYGRVEPIAKGLTDLRSYGIRIWTFIQNVKLLEDLYPGEWQTFLDNASVIYGATNDDEAAKKLSEAFGDVTYQVTYQETRYEKEGTGIYDQIEGVNPYGRQNEFGYWEATPIVHHKEQTMRQPIVEERIHHQTEEIVPIRAINNLPLPWQIIRPIGSPPVLCAKLPHFDPIFSVG